MGEKGDNNLDKIAINIKFHKKGGTDIPCGYGNVNSYTFSNVIYYPPPLPPSKDPELNGIIAQYFKACKVWTIFVEINVLNL